MSEEINLTNKDTGFSFVIECNVDNEHLELEFDKINENITTSTSDITTHPLVNGDVIADHMYRNPINVNVSGTFSLNGNQRTQYFGSNDRLTNIETLFEKIKKQGIFCTLKKINRGINNSVRFIQRENMVLNYILWKENQNTLDFTFTFIEVITINVEEPDADKDVTDTNLPAISEASSLDFTDTLLDWDEIDKIIVKQLHDVDLISTDFLKFSIETAGKYTAGVLVGTTVALGVAVLQGIGIALGVITGGIGTAFLVAAGAIAGGIYALYKSIKKKVQQKKYKQKAFELYKDDRKNQQECSRFYDYIGTIHQNLEYLENVLHVYGIGSNENQDCILYIDNNYYIFTFMKNNTDELERYSLHVEDINGNNIAEQSILTGLTNISECDNSTCLFRTSSGYYIYIINLKTQEAIDTGKNQNEINELNKDLTNFAIFVSEIDMKNFNDTLSEIVINAMTV